MNLKLGLRGLSIPDKLLRGAVVISASADNPLVPGNATVLSAFKTENDKMTEAINKVKCLEAELQSARSDLAQQERAWDAAYGALGAFTQSATQGEPGAIFSAGFDVRHRSGPSQPAGEVTNLIVTLTERPGETLLTWKRPKGAAAFLVQCTEDPNAETGWQQLDAVTDTQSTVNGAHPGQRVWFRVAAISAGGAGPWTQPVGRPIL